MALIGLRETATELYSDGRSWGRYGPYECLSAVADFAANPEATANRSIVDLDRAPRRDGTVRFDADLRILRPRTKGNGRLLLVVPNRGLLGAAPFSVDASMGLGPLADMGPGDGFLLHEGWTIAWCGWQWDVNRGPGSIGLQAPTVDVGAGWVRLELRPDEARPHHPLSDSSAPFFSFVPYPTADVADPDAVLTRRFAPDDEPEVVARDQWRFVGQDEFTIEGGFDPFCWYTLIYRTRLCPVAGTGLLAIRDAAAWLRQEYHFDVAVAYGVSQAGRLLRQYLYEGRNVDESGRVVFDGIFAHITGGRRGEFNHRYAQPAVAHAVGFANLPPYDTAGLLARQRILGGIPKLILTNSSWEYWRGDGALVHINPETGEDLTEDPDAREYLLTGTDHMGAVAYKRTLPVANPVHMLDVGPVLRALFVVLNEWISGHAQPPPSAVPRWTDGTAATRPAVLDLFSRMGTGYLPDVGALSTTREVDLGPDAEAGVPRWPCKTGAAKPAIVSAVNDSGNEVAGIALPAVSVPTAAYTGWNPRRPMDGLPNPLYEFVGSRLPVLSSDPPQIRSEYEKSVRAAAASLVAQRFLLDSDIERTVHEALDIYDELVTPVAQDHEQGIDKTC